MSTLLRAAAASLAGPAAIATSIGRAGATIRSARALEPAARASGIESAVTTDVEKKTTVPPAETLVCRWSPTTRSFSWAFAPVHDSTEAE